MVKVVVIGAGIVGSAAAHRLSMLGADVMLVDNRAPGAATPAGAGIIATIGSRATDLDTALFRITAARHYVELVRVSEEAGLRGHSYSATGQLVLALDDGEAAMLPAEFDRARDLVDRFGRDSVGMPELLSSVDIRRRFPLVATACGGLWLPEIARVDGRAMRDGLVQLARAAGATVINGTARLLIRDGRISGVLTTGGVLSADAVVVAAGAWSAGLGDFFGGRLRPQRGQIAHLRLPGASALPTLDTFAGHYLLPFPGDRAVIGATRETGSGFTPELTAGGVAQVLARGMSLVPALKDAIWIEARVGLRPVSDDGFPFLGPAPGAEGVWLATGMGPSGLTLGPYCGSVVAEHVMAISAAPAIPAAYDPRR